MDLKAETLYLLRQFPFIYPARVINSCEEWITTNGKRKGVYYSQRGPWFKTIFPEGFLHNNAPRTLGPPNEKAFYNNRNYPTAKATLFYLQNSYLFGHKGLIVTANNKVFQEFSHHFAIAPLKKFLWKNPFYIFSRKVKHINGIGAVLISPESRNYYHWLNDVLPRIKLYEDVLGQIDHFCIASNVPGKFIDILKDFGIPSEKILPVKAKEKLHFDFLYAASLPGSEGRSPQWAVDYVRQKLIKPSGTQPLSKKLYFKRGENAERKILNESEIVSTLKSMGFEIVDPGILSIYDQIRLMQNAKIIIGAHGAALSNLLFTRDNTIVIELFSSDYFRTDCYYTLSSIRELNYWYIVGEKPEGAHWGDIIVDEELLKKTVAHIDVDKSQSTKQN